MEKIIIAAVADNGAIGCDNALLWHIAEDMAFFKNTTSGFPVIMGYRTFLSIGRALPRRKNIVIITRPADLPEKIFPAHSIDEALRMAAEPVVTGPASGIAAVPEKCFIMGGAKTYAQSMSLADTLLITHVHTNIADADAFFPAIDPEIWKIADRSEMKTDPETGYTFEFVTYRK